MKILFKVIVHYQLPITNYLLIALLCLPAVWPLFSAPFFASDDGLFHLYRLRALDDAIQQGELYPRLFPQFAFDYGQAVFSYYGPLVYYIAEAVHLLGADFPDAIKLTFALGYVASGWTLFALARQHVAPLPALVGAVAYVYFPYHLADAYQRGALAEHWAFVWMPLILLQIADCRLQIFSYRGLVVLFSMAALILTHSLTALIFLPFAIIYHLRIRSASYTSCLTLHAPRFTFHVSRFAFHASRFTFHALISLISLPFLLTTFYWLPIIAQSRWVGLSAGLANDGYRFHLAPWSSFVQPSLIFQYAPNQLVAADHPLSLWSFITLLLALLALVSLWRRRDALRWPLTFFFCMTIIALFMAIEPSLWLWQILHNPLSFLQYPWRFLTLAALGLSLCLAISLETFARLLSHPFTPSPLHPLIPSSLHPVFPVYLSTCLLISLTLILTATAALPLRPLPAAPSDTQAMWQNDLRQKQIGATWTAEYMPWWVWADRTAIPLPRRAPASDVELTAPRVTPIVADYTLRRYQIQTEAPTLLRLHQFYLPQWRATLNGTPLATFPSTELGLLTIELPPNIKDANLEIDFALTSIEQLGIALSCITGLVIAWLWRGRGLIIPFGLLLIGALLWSRPLDHLTIRPSDKPTTIEDFADLIGVRISSPPHRAGDTAAVTLIWLARRETRENFKVFVHLMNADNTQVIAQSDGDPIGGFTPTSQWRVGEIIEDTHRLKIPAAVPVGTLPMFTGMYRSQPLKNLSATRAGQTVADGRIPLDGLQITP